MTHQPPPHQPNAVPPEAELDANLVRVAYQQNRIKNRSKRSPEWIFFADAGQWQTVNGEESKFRIANCRFCLKADIQTKIRGKIETMKNHILECDKIPPDQKAIYERHPGRHRKRVSGSAQDAAKRQKTEAALRSLGFAHIDGVENRAVVLHAARDMRIEKVPIPLLQSGHLLISMRSVGICGSDVHYWTEGRIGEFIVQKPMILGHEAAGVVRVVADDVLGFEAGDRVAIEPGIPCGVCNYCRAGKYNLCPHVKFAATPPVDGALAHFVAHPANFCYKLPPMISFDEAALFEPLSVGIHACRRGKVGLGDNVFVAGAGPIGLLTMLVAKASGAREVTISDIDTDRLQVAKEMGADKVILAHSAGDPKITAQGVDADISFDCTGIESAVKTCVFATKRGGVVVLVGMGKPEMAIPILEASVRELDIRGVFRYHNTYPTALELVASGKVNLKRLVTHRYKMMDAEEAFQTAHDRNNKAIKVVIDCTAHVPQPHPPTI